MPGRPVLWPGDTVAVSWKPIACCNWPDATDRNHWRGGISRIARDPESVSPEIPWADIIGMRNRLIHGYDFVDLNILWNTVKIDLPPLIEQLERILNR